MHASPQPRVVTYLVCEGVGLWRSGSGRRAERAWRSRRSMEP